MMADLDGADSERSAPCRGCGRAFHVGSFTCPHCGLAVHRGGGTAPYAGPPPFRPPGAPPPAPTRGQDLLRERLARPGTSGEVGFRGAVLTLGAALGALYLGFLGVRGFFRGEEWELVFVSLLSAGFLWWLALELERFTTAGLWLAALVLAGAAAGSAYFLDGGLLDQPAYGVAALAVALVMLDFLRARRRDFFPGGMDELERAITPYAEIGRPPPRFEAQAAVFAISDSIAREKRVCAVTEREARELAAIHGTSLERGLPNGRRALYRVYLKHFLADGRIDAAEADELACLQRLLALDDATVQALRRPFREGIYRVRMGEIMRGGRLGLAELDEMEALQVDLGLSWETARVIREKMTRGTYSQQARQLQLSARAIVRDQPALSEAERMRLSRVHDFLGI